MDGTALLGYILLAGWVIMYVPRWDGCLGGKEIYIQAKHGSELVASRGVGSSMLGTRRL